MNQKMKISFLSKKLPIILSLFCITCTSNDALSPPLSSITLSDGQVFEINDWASQFQNINIHEVSSSKFDLIVIDYSKDGSDEKAFTNNEVQMMKGNKDVSKILLAYLSIGEAEEYRYYFDASADYLHNENPLFPGNYKVFYWHAAWQHIIKSYLKRIIDAGFDGVYLDIIDAYEYFEPGGESGLNRESAAKDMVKFVIKLSKYAKSIKPDFLIFPQNGSGIIHKSAMQEEYFAAIDGVGAEDTFYFGDKNENNSFNEQKETISNLDIFIKNQKIVLAIDYLTEPHKIDDFYKRCREKQYIPYASTRNLDKLIVNKGLEPD